MFQTGLGGCRSQRFDKMLAEFAVSPNFLSGLASQMLAQPVIKPQEKKLYGKMCQRFAAINHPDLIFESTTNLSRSLQEQGKKEEAVSMPGKVILLYYQEASRIDPMLDLLE